MFVLKKNQMIITALVAMVAVAGYLSYIDKTTLKPHELMFNEDGELADYGYDELEAAGDIYYDDDIAIEYDSDSISASANADSAAAVSEEGGAEASAGDEAGKAVFVNTSNDSSYFIQAKLGREQARAKEKEKGFKEVYVRIDDDTVDVVVSKEELTSAETAQIQDIVKRKTGIDVKNIRITPMKKTEEKTG